MSERSKKPEIDKRPHWPFFSSDWRADDELQRCPIEAKGLWIEILTLVYRDYARGRLVTQAGIALRTPEEISAQLRLPDPIGQVRKAFAKLEEAKVFSREDDGTIYSRRAVRWYERSLTNSRNANARWDDDATRNANGTASRNAKSDATPKIGAHATPGSGSGYGSGSGSGSEGSTRGERRVRDVVRDSVPFEDSSHPAARAPSPPPAVRPGISAETKELIARTSGALTLRARGAVELRLRRTLRYAYRRQLLLPLALTRERDPQLRLPLLTLMEGQHNARS